MLAGILVQGIMAAVALPYTAWGALGLLDSQWAKVLNRAARAGAHCHPLTSCACLLAGRCARTGMLVTLRLGQQSAAADLLPSSLHTECQQRCQTTSAAARGRRHQTVTCSTSILSALSWACTFDVGVCRGAAGACAHERRPRGPPGHSHRLLHGRAPRLSLPPRAGSLPVRCPAASVPMHILLSSMSHYCHHATALLSCVCEAELLIWPCCKLCTPCHRAAQQTVSLELLHRNVSGCHAAVHAGVSTLT